MAARAIVMQQKTQRPVQFEITEQTREAVIAWIRSQALKCDDFLFPSRLRMSPHLSTRQYARIVRGWVAEIGLIPLPTELIPSAARRRRWSIVERRIFERFSCYWGTASSRARCATWALRWMML